MADVSLKIKSDFAQAQSDFESLVGTSENARAKIEKFTEGFKTEQIDRFVDRNKLMAAGVTATSGKVAGMTAEARGLQREIERLIRSGLAPNDEKLQELAQSYNKIQNELGETSSKVDRTTVSFGSLVKGIVGANLVERGLMAIKDGFVDIFQSAMKLEDAQAAFTPLLGGADQAKNLVDQLNVAAAQTPFRFEDISKAATTLLPVMNGDVEKTVETFKLLGDTAGGNAQKLETITRGFSKAMLKGKVDMESLNMIAEAGVPIFNEMADSMGYGKDNMDAFFKKISTGTVSTDELVKAFQQMTSEGGIFFQGMITASQTTSGVLSTLSDNISMVAAGIGQEFLPYIKEGALWISAIAGDILKWITTGDNLEDTLSAVGYIIAGLTAGLIAYTVANGAAVISTGAITTGIKAFTAAIAANPIGAIATVITALLIPALIYLYKNWDTVKFKTLDFILAAQIKFIELDNTIREKLIGGVGKLIKVFGEIPIIGNMFKGIVEGQQNVINTNNANIESLTRLRESKRKDYEESMLELNSNSGAVMKNANDIMSANNQIKQSYKERFDLFKKQLDSSALSENQKHTEMLEAAKTFFVNRAKLESDDWAERLIFLQSQYDSINEMAKLSAEERAIAEEGLTKAIEEQSIKQAQSVFNTSKNMLDSISSISSSIGQILENTSGDTRAAAEMQKGIAMVMAAINTALAVTNIMANSPPITWPVAIPLAIAAGLAQEIAIATTPIPTAQTGIEYTVPDIPQFRNDSYGVMASAGETVSVKPRGEENNKSQETNIYLDTNKIFTTIQNGIMVGKMNVFDRNIGRRVFA